MKLEQLSKGALSYSVRKGHVEAECFMVLVRSVLYSAPHLLVLLHAGRCTGMGETWPSSQQGALVLGYTLDL